MRVGDRVFEVGRNKAGTLLKIYALHITLPERADVQFDDDKIPTIGVHMKDLRPLKTTQRQGSDT